MGDAVEGDAVGGDVGVIMVVKPARFKSSGVAVGEDVGMYVGLDEGEEVGAYV